MPQRTVNAPDLIDLENMCSALGESYHVVVYFTARVRGGKMELIGKTHGPPYTEAAPVEHVALVSIPIQYKPDMVQKMYTLAFDLWCQHDGGGATAAKRGNMAMWDGRYPVPRRRR